MKLYVYAPKNLATSTRLEKVLNKHKAIINISFFREFDVFIQQFKQPAGIDAVIVILISNTETLSLFYSYFDLLEGTQIILVLPNRELKTLTQAHLLRPRYLSFTDTDLSDIEQVLKKMLEHRQPKK